MLCFILNTAFQGAIREKKYIIPNENKVTRRLLTNSGGLGRRDLTRHFEEIKMIELRKAQSFNH